MHRRLCGTSNPLACEHPKISSPWPKNSHFTPNTQSESAGVATNTAPPVPCSAAMALVAPNTQPRCWAMTGTNGEIGGLRMARTHRPRLRQRSANKKPCTSWALSIGTARTGRSGSSMRQAGNYQFGSRSGVAVILWMLRSAPSYSSSWSRRKPRTAFSPP